MFSWTSLYCVYNIIHRETSSPLLYDIYCIIPVKCVPARDFSWFSAHGRGLQQTDGVEKKISPRRQRTRTSRVFFSFSPPIFLYVPRGEAGARALHILWMLSSVHVKSPTVYTPPHHPPSQPYSSRRTPCTRDIFTRKIALSA